jgi:opacity protein-like surface antigen
MKRQLIAGFALGLVAIVPATAADMRAAPILTKAPMMAPAFSWTGCYLDAGAGYGMWNQDHSTTTGFTLGGVPTPNVTTEENTGGGRGWLGRFGAGCDYQLGGGFSNFVIGVFGDYDVMSLKGSMSPLLINGSALLADEKESAAWAVGGRIGYVIAPSVLTYVNGGWTETRFDQMNVRNSLGLSTTGAFPEHTYKGWFIGSGFEYNFTWLPIPGLFLRSEYRYATYQKDDLPEFDVVTGGPTGNFGFGNVLHASKQVQTVTTSLVWRFGGFH